MKKHFITFLIVIFTFKAYPQDNIGLPMVRNFTPEAYGGGIQNWMIIQDYRGVIYVANNFGLLQYDGNSWRNYPVIGATKLRSIALGDDGRIYAGLQGDFGYYAPDSIGILQYHSLKNLLPKGQEGIDETWRTYVINDKVYFCTFQSIFVYDGDRINVITKNKALDVSYLSKNNIYSQVRGEGLFQIRNDQFAKLPYGATFKDKIVSGVISLNKEESLIATSQNGIYIADNTTAKPWHEHLNKIFKATFINDLILLNSGEIAIGTQHNGVYIVKPTGEITLHLDKDEGLFNHTILSLFEDLNNNIWVGQNNGISFAKLKSPFKLINEEVGLPGTGYSALKKGNETYLGTNNGAFVLENGNINSVEGTQGQVYAIQNIRDRILMSHHSGAFEIKKDKAFQLSSTIGTWMFLEMGDTLLKGTYGGIKLLNNNFEEVGNIKNLHESSRVLLKENDSTIWMSHGYKGLYKLSTSKRSIIEPQISFYNSRNKLPSDYYNNVEWINGHLKFITEDGIYDYKNNQDSFVKDTLLSNYFDTDEQILSLKSDVFGNIYFITSESLGFLEKNNTSGFIRHSEVFNSIRGLLNDDLPNINIIGSNTVLFGAKEGFILFDRNLFWTTENELFQTLIRRVAYGNEYRHTINGGDIDQSPLKKQEIEYTKNNLIFEFASTSFTTSIPTEFQYKLEGFGDNWSEWTANTSKEYTNLKEGSYTFNVRSRNADGKVSDTATYSFIVLPPWYRTYWSYTAYALLIVIGIGGIVYLQQHRHSKEKAELEEKRRKQLSEKEEQLDTITKQSEFELNKLRNEKLESEIKHMDTELATNTMHLLNKNEFINKIKSNLESVEKKSVNKEVKALIKRVIKDISKNIETDGDWENFQIHFDKVHGNFSTRIKKDFPGLTPQEIKLSAYLRLNLSTKEIANLLNISVRGVEIARYRLRKKLNLDRNQNLTEFILNF